MTKLVEFGLVFVIIGSSWDCINLLMSYKLADSIEYIKCVGLTHAVVMITVCRRIMFAQSLQDEFVVHEALDGLEQECV